MKFPSGVHTIYGTPRKLWYWFSTMAENPKFSWFLVWFSWRPKTIWKLWVLIEVNIMKFFLFIHQPKFATIQSIVAQNHHFWLLPIRVKWNRKNLNFAHLCKRTRCFLTSNSFASSFIPFLHSTWKVLYIIKTVSG